MKRVLRWLRRLLWAVMIAALIILGLNVVVMKATIAQIKTVDEVRQADCILVLGCGVHADGTPGNMLTNRLDTAIDLYNRGAAPKLLMSGDHGSADYDEVNAMKRYAVQHGVPAEDVFMDHAGFSTYESMKRAREVFGCERIVIVTQGYHLFRSIWDAQAMGMQAQGVEAAMYDDGWRNNAWLILRENLARVKDMVWCLLDLPAAYMGQPISIAGNAAVTDDDATRVWMEQLNMQ